MDPRLLTVAGSDPAGGAGLQLDLKVFAALGGDGAAVPVLLTAQTAAGLERVDLVDPRAVASALRSALEQPPAAAKTGALGDAATVVEVARALADHPELPLVVDPVGAPSLAAVTGLRLLAEDALPELREKLMPLATLVTPNLAECAALLGLDEAARDREEMRAHALALLKAGARAVLLKGGHLPAAREGDAAENCPDFLCAAEGKEYWVEGLRIPGAVEVHGTGCALSAAICARLGQGAPLRHAVAAAKDDVTRWLRAAKNGRLLPR